MIDNMIKTTFDQIPKFIKEMDSYDQYCNLMKIVQLTLIGLTKVDKHQVSRIMVWGTTGSGKTTLIKIMGTILNLFTTERTEKALPINDHQTGTKEVTVVEEVFIGCRKLELMDVPGTNDLKDAYKESVILEQINKQKGSIDSILYILDISKPRHTNEDLFTLVNLAHGFKDIGIDLWKKVVIVFTKANQFNIERIPPPEYDFEKKSDDYDKEYIQEYRKWIKQQNEELAKRISIRKDNFKGDWFTLFDSIKTYPNISLENKEKIFNKIRFVVAGHVINFTRESYSNSCIIPIPNYKVSHNLHITDDGKELQNEIDNGDYTLCNNWLQELLNSVIMTTSNKLKLDCHMANNEYMIETESKNEDNRKQKINKNNTPVINFTQEAVQEINETSYKIIVEQNKINKKGALGYVLSGTGGSSVVGICAKVLLVTAGAGLGIALFAAVGFAVGAGIYHII